MRVYSYGTEEWSGDGMSDGDNRAEEDKGKTLHATSPHNLVKRMDGD